MGGIRVDTEMQTRIAGLYAAGEAVGGANGANRLSGNAITEAFVFGERAGASAALKVKQESSHWHETLAEAALERLRGSACSDGAGAPTPISLQAELQKLMWENAGPFRSGEKLSAARRRIAQMQQQLPELRVGAERQFNLDLQDWFELRAMLTTAAAIVTSALARSESRGAHQREDFPAPDDSLLKNQAVALDNGELRTSWIAPVRLPGG
jgi:succinate dehydrogenase/fumarate reductase flavoprotein subunit